MTIPNCYDNDNIDDDDNWVPVGSFVDSSISVKLEPRAIFKNYNLLFVIGQALSLGKNGKKDNGSNFEPQHLHSRKKKETFLVWIWTNKKKKTRLKTPTKT